MARKDIYRQLQREHDVLSENRNAVYSAATDHERQQAVENWAKAVDARPNPEQRVVAALSGLSEIAQYDVIRPPPELERQAVARAIKHLDTLSDPLKRAQGAVVLAGILKSYDDATGPFERHAQESARPAWQAALKYAEKLTNTVDREKTLNFIAASLPTNSPLMDTVQAAREGHPKSSLRNRIRFKLRGVLPK